MAWYRVVKTIKGHRYLYDQRTYREGGQVRTLNRYIGRADGVSLRSGASHSVHANAPGGFRVTTTPDKRGGSGNVPRIRTIKQLTPEEQEKWEGLDHWIRSELSNNEYDSDEELIKSFTSDGNMTREEASASVGKRGFFLSNIVMNDGTVYDPHGQRNAPVTTTAENSVNQTSPVAMANDAHRRYFDDKDIVINSSADAVKVFRDLLQREDTIDQDKEHFYVMHLDVRSKVKMVEVVSVGILSASYVHPRETFRRAIVEGSDKIIVAHNHPSGEVSPSEDDTRTTKLLVIAQVAVYVFKLRKAGGGPRG